MKAIILVGVLASYATADTFKLGDQIHIKHGCASPHAATVLRHFLMKDPTFVFNTDKVTLTETTLTADQRGTHEHSWLGEMIDRYTSHWVMPVVDDAQVRLIVDTDPIKQSWCDNATCSRQSVKFTISIVSDYDPEHDGKHANVCAESWFGQMVRL